MLNFLCPREMSNVEEEDSCVSKQKHINSSHVAQIREIFRRLDAGENASSLAVLWIWICDTKNPRE